jgi:hypothetical protein
MTLQDFLFPAFKSITQIVYKSTIDNNDEGMVEIKDCYLLVRSLFVENRPKKFYFPLNQEVKIVKLGIIVNDITGKQYELNFFSNDEIIDIVVVI